MCTHFQYTWCPLLTTQPLNSGADGAGVELLEFSGIHSRLSHKAHLYQLARRFFPSRFRLAPIPLTVMIFTRHIFRFAHPFDRHDWIVRRPQTNKKVRYIIDYYSLRKGIIGDPEFHLDVRPAMDSFENVKVRLVAISVDLLSGVFGPSVLLVGLPLLPVRKFITHLLFLCLSRLDRSGCFLVIPFYHIAAPLISSFVYTLSRYNSGIRVPSSS
jgi:hypothetical protein